MHRYLNVQRELFDPGELAELVGAFHKACHSACKHTDVVDDDVRRLLATRIVEKAKTGELDQDRLCQDAMDYLAVTLSTLHQTVGLSTEAAA